MTPYFPSTRRAIMALGFVFMVAVGLQALLCLPAQAQQGAKAKRLQITSFEVDNLGTRGQGAILRIKTADGTAIPADQIKYTTRGNVLRVTFKDIPMHPSLGLDVAFDTKPVRGIDKGYALKENNWQSFARLKFTDKADNALKKSEIIPIKGGVELHFPFGKAIAATPAPMTAPKADIKPAKGAFGWANNKSAKPAATKPAAIKPAKPMMAKPAIAKTTPEKAMTKEAMTTNTATTDTKAAMVPAAIAPVAMAPAMATPTTPTPEKTMMAPTANTPQPVATPSTGTPLQLMDTESGPTMGRVLGGLLVVCLLMIALAFLARKLQSMRGGNSSRKGVKIPTNGVRVLATHSMGRHNKVMVLDALGEILVVGQGQAGMTLLHRLEPEQVEALSEDKTTKRKTEVTSRQFVDKVMSSGPKSIPVPLDTDTRFALEQVAAKEGSLQELALSLDQEMIDPASEPFMKAIKMPTDKEDSVVLSPSLQKAETSLGPIARSIRSSAALAAVSHDLNPEEVQSPWDEPLDFQEVLRKRAAQANSQEAAEPLRPTGTDGASDMDSMPTAGPQSRRAMLREVLASTPTPSRTEDVISIRDRARSLGRL